MSKKEVAGVLREGQVLTVSVEGYSSEGYGVGRVDGQVVFVKGGLRGEECAVEIEHVGHRAAWGRVTALSATSPHREEPLCPHYGRCGGCQTRHMDYAEELRFKAEKVANALRRIGGLAVEAVPIHGAERPQRYRNKVQFPVAGGEEGPAIGYFAPRSHRVIDVEDCLLAPQGCAAARRAVGDYMVRFGVSAYDERTGTGLVRHLFVRHSGAGQALVCLMVNGEALPQEGALVEALQGAVPGLAGVVLGVNTRRDNVILGDRTRTLWGQDYLMDTLGGLEFKLSVPSFFQVNRAQAEVLYGLAAHFAGLTGGETVLDLYCGTGTIGLTMARRAKALIGVEIAAPAVADATENARRNGIGNARFLCADAGQAAGQLEAEGVRPDVVVVDPPRKGLSPEVIQVLVRMGPRRIVYVSCDPATLARDLKELSEHYALTGVEAVDMFPRTHHVETVCRLEHKM